MLEAKDIRANVVVGIVGKSDIVSTMTHEASE